MFKKSPYPAIYYIYGNSKYREELEEMCKNFFPMCAKLTVSNPNGCGFKVECYDPNDLARFDVEIEKYEAWVQNYRKTDFNDVKVDYLDLDEITNGTNTRKTYNPKVSSDVNIGYLNWVINASRKQIAIREMKFLSNSSTKAGVYDLQFDDDHIIGIIPIGQAHDINKMIRKNLNGGEFKISCTDADLIGYIIEYLGEKEYRQNVIILGTGALANFDSTNALDGDISTKSFGLMPSTANRQDLVKIYPNDPEYKKLFLCTAFRAASDYKVQVWMKAVYPGGRTIEFFDNIFNTATDYKVQDDSWLSIELPECGFSEIQVFFSTKNEGVYPPVNTVYWSLWDIFFTK